MKTKYVVGLAFNPSMDWVVLIKKNKPTWQAGHLNGVGGKIEKGEHPLDAMRREYEEETGVSRHEGILWRPLGVMRGEQFELYVFCTIDEPAFSSVRTQEGEEVNQYEVAEIMRGKFMCISNLYWMIEFARDRNPGGNLPRFTIDY